MVADTILAIEKRTERSEDRSATIFVVGKVTYIGGVVQLDDKTRLHCRRAVKEYYQRTKIINRRRNGVVTGTRITNEIFLVVTSFDRRKREHDEAIEQIKCCFASYQHIPEEHIIEVRDGKSSLVDVAVLIKNKKLPSNVIVIGDEPLFTWRNPLTTSFKKNGITVEYLGDTDLVAVFPY